MHASMITILSGCQFVDSPASRESVRKNTEMVFQQVAGFAELLKQFVAKDLDMTRLWPFSGYAAFVTGSVIVVRTGSRHKCYTHLSPSTSCKLGKCYLSGIYEWKARGESTKQTMMFAKSILSSVSFQSHSC
jgi:hypothetical protein